MALSNTTLGMLAATVNASIVIISLPAIFRGIHLNPLTPSNISYLLWMLMGYLVVSAVLVVTLGRLGDIYGRVKMYNLGFTLFALGALALPFDPLTGPGGALWLIGFRIIQAVGGAMLMANSPAILTDAFPFNQRGMAMGINQVAGISGQFIGLILGGILAAVNWRLVFLVSVPIGIGGAIWSYLSLQEVGARTPAKIDWLGNVTFAVGLIALLTGITYGIQPYGGHSMGWTSPVVLTGLIGGVALLVAFCFIELRVDSPMFDLRLLKIRSFSTGVDRGAARLDLPRRHAVHADHLAAGDLAGAARLLVHRHAAVVGHLPAAADRRVPGRRAAVRLPVRPVRRQVLRLRRPAGLGAASFGGLLLVPTNFSYPVFAILIFVSGAGMGLFSAPNAAAVMNSVPPKQRGAASGMLATFTNSGFVLSIGIFFSLMIAGLASTLPTTLTRGLTGQGVPRAIAHQIGQPAAGRQPVRRVPRLQPGTPAARPDRRAQPPARAQRARADRQAVLPAAHLRPVPPRPGDRVHDGHDRVWSSPRCWRCATAAANWSSSAHGRRDCRGRAGRRDDRYQA